MKKIFIGLLMASLLLGLIASPVSAASKGAVKTDLTVYQKGSGDIPVGTVVGSAVLNSTANGILNVLVNIDSVPNMVDYDIRVWVDRAANPTTYATFVDVLDTNAQGQGNASVKVDLSQFNITGAAISVIVVLRPSMALQTQPCYTTDWPNGVLVPLK